VNGCGWYILGHVGASKFNGAICNKHVRQKKKKKQMKKK
jgi:hypothetical protein